MAIAGTLYLAVVPRLGTDKSRGLLRLSVGRHAYIVARSMPPARLWPPQAPAMPLHATRTTRVAGDHDAKAARILGVRLR
jgi:hypothetical protein